MKSSTTGVLLTEVFFFTSARSLFFVLMSDWSKKHRILFKLEAILNWHLTMLMDSIRSFSSIDRVMFHSWKFDVVVEMRTNTRQREREKDGEAYKHFNSSIQFFSSLFFQDKEEKRKIPSVRLFFSRSALLNSIGGLHWIICFVIHSIIHWIDKWKVKRGEDEERKKHNEWNSSIVHHFIIAW